MVGEIGMSMPDYKKKYLEWRDDPRIDEATRDELRGITDEKEIEDRFYKDLAFGTGGLRGIIGAGTNRMNKYTVTRATQGLAEYIIRHHAQGRGVAIAFDSRHMSKEFAQETALCLNANGISTYIFETLRPTPELSFAIRQLGCYGGIVITASHNPPEYNGYKVYGEDGSQITDVAAQEIMEAISSIDDMGKVKSVDMETATKQGLYHLIGSDIDDLYIANIKKLVLSPEAVRDAADQLKIVYTPLHGTGNLLVRRVLKELGFGNAFVVKEQEEPDGDFPTVEYPNPEDPRAFRLALELARNVDADLVLATDPDADRLGVYAKDEGSGEYKAFTGNMSGLLIAEYELSRKQELGLLPENRKDGALVKTIVSSNMANEIVKEYGISLIEVLTGFKYIGEQIKFFEEARKANHGVLDAEKGAYEYLFGYEESYGCLVGTHARDKDACVAVMALCEAAAYYKGKGISLWQQMLNIYEKYGYYKEALISVTMKGVDGSKKMEDILRRLRENPPTGIGSFRVQRYRDYRRGETTDVSNGIKEQITLPRSNVLYYELEQEAWVCIRPSGTEPKVKLYVGVKGRELADAKRQLDGLTAAARQLLEA